MITTRYSVPENMTPTKFIHKDISGIKIVSPKLFVLFDSCCKIPVCTQSFVPMSYYSRITFSESRADDCSISIMNVSWPNLFNSAPREPQHAAFDDAARKLESTEDKVEAMKHELLRVRLQREFDYQAHNASFKVNKRRLRTLRDTYEKKKSAVLEDMALHQYAKVLKTNSTTPSYILIVQAKALRNLHQFCIMDAQLKLVEMQSADLIASMKEHRLGLMLEQSEVQKEGLNHMVRLQMEDEALSSSFRKVLRKQSEQLLNLHDSLNLENSYYAEETAPSGRPAQPQTLDELLCKLNVPTEEVSPTSVRQFLKLEMPSKGAKDGDVSSQSSFSFSSFRMNLTSLSRNQSAGLPA
jgi:hypothetical protein